VTTRSPLLAVIDMQRIFAEPDSGWAVPRFDEVVGPVRELVRAFEPRVVFTRFVAPDLPHGAWETYYETWPFALQAPDSYAYQLIDDLGEGRPTLDATTFGKWGQDLAGRVGPDGHLVLAGVSTDCCVLSTALAAVDAGVHVRVVADACAGVDDASHRKALDVMNLYAPMLEVVTLAAQLERHASEVQQQ